MPHIGIARRRMLTGTANVGAWLLAGVLARGHPAGAAAGVEVRIKDFMFEPAHLKVPAGTSVVFTNTDDEPHVIVSVAKPPLFRSEALDTGESFAVVLRDRGVFGYYCTLHPHMQGSVEVE